MKLPSFLVIFSYLLIGIFAIRPKDEVDVKEYTFEIKKYTEEIFVENNSIINIKFNNFPPNGCIWSFKQPYEDNNFYEFLEKIENDDWSIFKFSVKNLTESSDFPKIEFIMLPYDDRQLRKSVGITLKLKPKYSLPLVEYRIGHENTEVSVEPNSQLSLILGTDTTESELWVISNVSEITKTGLVEYKGINFTSDCDIINIGPMKKGCKDYNAFLFEIKNVTDKKSLPTLKFELRDSNVTVEVTLNLTKEAPEIPDTPLKEYTYQVKEDTEIAVSSNSLVKIELEEDLSVSQHEWLISNANVIESTGLVEIAGNTINLCGGKEDCPNTVTFSFRIKEIEEGDILPKIMFSYDDMFLWQSGERKITVTLKREGELEEKKEEEKKEEPNNASEVCTFKDYPCCTKANPKVYYHDKDGDWGVEKGDWCFIKKEEENKEALSNATCQPKGGYPVCKTTKKVVYTDSDKWGVEHNQWCILCN